MRRRRCREGVGVAVVHLRWGLGGVECAGKGVGKVWGQRWCTCRGPGGEEGAWAAVAAQRPKPIGMKPSANKKAAANKGKE